MCLQASMRCGTRRGSSGVRTRVCRASTAPSKATIEVWCKGMLKTLKEGQSARYLSGGEFGIDNKMEEIKKHLKHT